MSDPNHNTRIPGIDGLRAIAVLSVIIFHVCGSVLPGGFIGVDVFFVISGYVVCGSLLRDPTTSYRQFITAFYARRILRIFPALIALLLVTALVSTLFIPNSHLTIGASKIGLSAFYGLSNIGMLLFGGGYFTVQSEYVVYTHTWSLGVEEQFYFLFPLVLYFILTRKNASGGIKTNWLAVLTVLVLGSLVYSAWETFHRHDYAYYLLPSRLWELGFGACLSLGHARGRLLPSKSGQSSILVLTGALLIGLSAFLATPKLFPFPWGVPAVVGTVLAIAGVVGPIGNDWVTAFLKSRSVVYIGRISYSAYLWHWPVVVLFRWTCGSTSPLEVILIFLVTAILSAASYHFIETPFQKRSSFFKQHKNMVVFGGLLLIVLTSAIFLVIVQSRSVLGLSVVSRNPQVWETPSITNGVLSSGNQKGPWSQKRLFVVGDSHAWAYSGILKTLLTEKGLSVYLNFVGGAHVGSLMEPMTEADHIQARKALSDLKNLSRPGDVVFLASLRVMHLCDQDKVFDLDKVIQQRDSTEAEVKRRKAVDEGLALIDELNKLGLVVIIDAPKPVLRTPPFRCSDWFNKNNPIGKQGLIIDRDLLLKHREPAMRSIREICSKYPQTQVWDPFQVLCPGPTFNAFKNGKPLFFDGDHLSNYGNETLYPSFVAELAAIWETETNKAKVSN
jgi:peptidoglycan/LPS O-acetylase OafA/YrhL